MGLDMAAGWLDKEQENKPVTEFDWRKHASLNEYMRQLYYRKKGMEAPQSVMDCEFNCSDVYLTREDIIDLKQAIHSGQLPKAKDGFFWGQDAQEESAKYYFETDKEFCERALAWLDQGKVVWYSPWW